LSSLVLFITKIHIKEIMIVFQYCKTYNVSEIYIYIYIYIYIERERERERERKTIKYNEGSSMIAIIVI